MEGLDFSTPVQEVETSGLSSYEVRDLVEVVDFSIPVREGENSFSNVQPQRRKPLWMDIWFMPSTRRVGPGSSSSYTSVMPSPIDYILCLYLTISALTEM